MSDARNKKTYLSRLARGCNLWGWLVVILCLIAAYEVVVRNIMIVCGPNRTQSTMHDLQAAISNFRAEYHHFPGSPVLGASIPTSDPRDPTIRSEGIPLLSLLALDESNNSQQIKFIDLPEAKKGKFGLVVTSGSDSWPPTGLELHDLWGEKYYLVLDIDEDGKVPNPEAHADAAWLAKHRQPAFLSTSVAIYSAGPDRDPKTWADNITSWR